MGQPNLLARNRNDQIEHIWSDANGWMVHSRAATPHAPGAPDVVLVHGLVVSSAYMQPLGEQLAPDYQVYIPDFPGYGKSEKPEHTLSIPELADALLSWMDSVGLEQPLVVGNSFGCQITVEFAMRYPDRTRGIVLVGPTVDPWARNLPTQIVRWLRNAANEPPSLGGTIIKDVVRAGPVRALESLRIYVNDRVDKKLPLVPTPALVVRGALDPLVPERWAHEMLDLLPHSEHAVIPGVGHTANYAAPLEIARVTRLFDQHLQPVSRNSGGGHRC